MHNLRNRGLFDKAHLENITSTLDQTLSDAYYRKWFGIGNLHDDLNQANSVVVATFACAGGAAIPVLQMPDAVTTEVILHTVKPKYWLDGNVRFDIHWMNDTASVNTFRLAYAAQTAISGAVPVLLTAVAAVVPGIAVADSYRITSLPSFFRITNEIDAISFRLLRLGGHGDDTNTDAFNLVGIEMIYQPGRTVVGVSG